MGDHGAGMAAAAGIGAALVARERTGRGQLVSSSLLRHGLYTISFDLATTLRFGVSIAVADRRTMGNPTINPYRDRDGRWFWVVGLEGERHWPPLARAVGTGGSRTPCDARRPRAQRRGAVAGARRDLRDAHARGGAEVLAAEEDLVSPCSRSRRRSGTRRCARRAGSSRSPTGGTDLPAPVDFGHAVGAARDVARAGQHTDEVLAELGRAPRAIAALRRRARRWK
jgi:crotonobetainyl-CoA:carnitine CoA-transferase CaiB-like acyl-CoA transferase